MSWSYSRALVEAYSDQCLTDIEQSAPSSTTPTHDLYYWPDKTTEHSRLSRFGMTSAPLTECRGEELLTWYLEGFPVKTYQSQGQDPESQANDQGYGLKWQESLGRYDPDTRSLKTAQLCLLGGSTSSSPTFTKWGSMQNGELFPQPIAERHTKESASGFWPTPQTRGFTNDGDLMALGKMASSYEEMSGMAYRASDKKKRQFWPTPTASMSNGTSKASLHRKDGRSRINDRLDHHVMASHGGQLNPTWVEWLMGWPIGQTDLKPLETDRFQSWLQQHSIY